MSRNSLHILDTNIVIHLLKGTPPEVRDAWQKAGGHTASAVSVLTLHELRFGAENSRRPEENHRLLSAFLSKLRVLDFDTMAAEESAKIRHESKKQPIGPVDCLIAGHARSLGATLVTRNVKEFRRVPGLKVVAW